SGPARHLRSRAVGFTQTRSALGSNERGRGNFRRTPKLMERSNTDGQGRAAAAAVFGCIAAAASYSTIRLLEHFFMPEPDPGAVIWSARSGSEWRLAISVYLGGALGGLAWALAGTPSRRRTLVGCLSVTIVGSFFLVLLQGLLCP